MQDGQFTLARWRRAPDLWTPPLQDDAPVRQWKLGAVGHGTNGKDLAERLCAQIRAWSDNRDEQPSVIAYTPDHALSAQPGQVVISKSACRLTVAFLAGTPAN